MALLSALTWLLDAVTVFFGLHRGALVVGHLSCVVDSDGSVGRPRGGVGDLGG
jgi:hypothetical protein